VNAIRLEWSAWAISLIVNLLVLLVMHCIVHERSWQPGRTVITSILTEPLEREFDFVAATEADILGSGGGDFVLTPAMNSTAASTDTRGTRMEEIEQLVTPTLVEFSEMVDMPMQDELASTFASRGQTDIVAGGAEGAMDRLAFEIDMSLKERQTLVVWLFDASGSLRDRRDAIAERFERVYKQLETRGRTEGLYTALAVYGLSTNLLTPDPVVSVRDLGRAIRSIETDKSGVENVFAAVHQTVERWKRFRRSEGRWNKMVIIVTDERGDDIDALEPATTLCKQFGIRVYTLGNAAVFGRREGYVDYRDDDGYVHRNVVVDQGPESAFPEQVRLAYWGGGHDGRLLRMSASYGPYGLTRLCTETGGMYLIAEEHTAYRFDAAVMRDYTPDYRPLRVLTEEVLQHPAKAALVKAATEAGVEDVPSPDLAFRADDDTILRRQLTAAQQPLADFQYHVDKLYALLEPGMQARDTLHEPRWRAAFDLALGRVLAMRVRAYGYNVMLANMKVTPQTFQTAGNNLWRLVPSDAIETGPSVRKYAEQARTLLQGVVDEHAGTPWAMLAAGELRQPLGWEWQEGRIDIEAILAGNQDASRRLLLEEERDRLDEKKPEPSEERPPPKL
jgi:hypothetical protein